MKDSLLILSGGMDSVTMLHEYKDRIAAALTFDYGANHNERESGCAAWQCGELGIEWLTVKMDFFGRLFVSSLLQGGDAVPDGEYAESGMHSTVVPFRNGIMLSIAAGVAESRGLTTVMMANHGGDHSIYPDCRPEFVEAMDQAIHCGTYAGVRLEAPYTSLTKAEIALRGLRMGVDYNHTYSCYRGGDQPCGRCATCLEREAALAAAAAQLAQEQNDKDN